MKVIYYYLFKYIFILNNNYILILAGILEVSVKMEEKNDMVDN